MSDHLNRAQRRDRGKFGGRGYTKPPLGSRLGAARKKRLDADRRLWAEAIGARVLDAMTDDLDDGKRVHDGEVVEIEGAYAWVQVGDDPDDVL